MQMRKPRIYLKRYDWRSFWAVDRTKVPYNKLSDEEKQAVQQAHAFKRLLQARLDVEHAKRELDRIEKEYRK